MPGKVCNKITNPFSNFNSGTIEVYEWISNFVSHFVMDAILIQAGI